MRNRLPALSAAIGLAIAGVAPNPCGAATLKTLVAFDNKTNPGGDPLAGLTGDNNGNLFGTTSAGGVGTNAQGTVFEIIKNFNGTYAHTVTTLATFTGDNGAEPHAGVTLDATGNVFGTTRLGGTGSFYPDGTVFEIAKTATGYSAFGTVLNFGSFNGAIGTVPVGGVTIDADGNVLGTGNAGGSANLGTVFEIRKNGVLALLVNFQNADGAHPVGNLVIDANGNLLGMTSRGGVNNGGVVFEIAKTGDGYATTPTLIADFGATPNLSAGMNPTGGLIADENGNLFGVTSAGGQNGGGVVFKIAKSDVGYFPPRALVSFNARNPDSTAPQVPKGGLVIDANGDLFGTTSSGGQNGTLHDRGTVYEIPKTNGDYASTPTVLINFTVADGWAPKAGLIADAKGNLFGTTTMNGPGGFGTVFEVTNSGFVPFVAFAGQPGRSHCFGDSVSALLEQDHNLDAAAQALGLDNAEALQSAILRYCRPSAS